MEPLEPPRPSEDAVEVHSNQQWMQRHRQVLATAAHRTHDSRFGLVFVRGQGARLWDADGQAYFDLTCGYSASNFGHAYPPLQELAARQLGQLTHLTGDAHPAKIELAEQLIDTCWQPPSATTAPPKVLFNATGARAVETAWKASQAFRPGKLLVLSPGFHGRSIATASISDTPRCGPQLAPGAFTVEPSRYYPYCAQCPCGAVYPQCDVRCSTPLLERVAREAEGLSAVLVEPAVGARGYIFPPAEFFCRLADVARQHGVLLIADEIQTGLGRCGDWLCSRLQGWQPDLIVLGKSLGGGIVPISAVVGRGDVLDAVPSGAESETFAATPLACHVALGVLQELKTGPWFARSRWLGEQLRGWCAEHLGPIRPPLSPTLSRREQGEESRCSEPSFAGWVGVQRIEGCGGNCVLEFAGPACSLSAAQEHALRFAGATLTAGLLCHLSGPVATRLVLLPPLTMTDQELAQVTQRLTAARDACGRATPPVASPRNV